MRRSKMLDALLLTFFCEGSFVCTSKNRRNSHSRFYKFNATFDKGKFCPHYRSDFSSKNKQNYETFCSLRGSHLIFSLPRVGSAPYKFAGGVVWDMMFKAMHYLCVLGTSYIEAVALSECQHFLR